ncbi:28S ribosomal protein S14, mitochondrial [Copidosoma floridanum]|uniref:28S ribosomal protein S14, mitochondrial n=1 Tax=Copidosoma floridanum TaxID=29053 RepID=UPI0006C9D755|nr:28S ribosomal protein S14, mitochondrial [Copidosoma floridanum]
MAGNIANSASPVLSKIISAGPSFTSFGFQQVRNKWTKFKTMRDMKRRQLTKESAPDRLRLLGLKRNNILPLEIRDLASQTFVETIPKCSSKIGVTRRCVVTSRGYGTVYRWRISRFVFRHLADHNLLSGVQRAMW